VNIQLWDTAGQERYRSIAPLYVRGSFAGLVVFDRSVAATLDSIKEWVDIIRENEPGVQLILVGSKSDLEHQPLVPHERAHAVKEELRMQEYIATSAKNGMGIDVLMHKLKDLIDDRANKPVGQDVSARNQGTCC
jgi:small GTP-binding protein